MRKLSLLLILSVVTCIIFFISCKKAPVANPNKFPIANAGPDQAITLPTDSVSLDGTVSSDPDGTISSFLWTKISGPVSFTINNSSASRVVAKNLTGGIYLFELKVTDKGGLIAKDTVRVIVNDPSQLNPPVANVGPDRGIILPANVIGLDGSRSSDPDNNIIAYHWTKISGPLSFNIVNVNSVQTTVTNLVQGVYQFELKVTDAGGLFSNDTIQVIVHAACDISSRPLISSQLIPVGTLSQTRAGIAIASAGNKILFAGGYISVNHWSSRVDIFDITTNSWTTASLSQARSEIAATSLGNKIFFAGGYSGGNTSGNSSRVDIYDVAADTWATAELSIGRSLMAAAAAGNKVLFAGGFGWGAGYYPHVDIYDVSANTWTADLLSDRPGDASVGIAATVIGTKIYFAGSSGDWPDYDFGDLSSTINIYDAVTGTWSTSSLEKPRGFLAGISVDNKNYWAGGDVYPYLQPPGNTYTELVETGDMNTSPSSFGCLFQPNAYFSAVQKNNKIVFFTGNGAVSNKFDIYDITTDTWSIGVLPVNIKYSSIISVNNTIYVAGGYVNGVLSDQVWKLEF